VCAIFVVALCVCVLASIRVAVEREELRRSKWPGKTVARRVADREPRGLRVDASNIVVVAHYRYIMWTTLQREGVKSDLAIIRVFYFFLPSRSERVVAAYRRWPEGETHIFSSNDGAIVLYLMWDTSRILSCASTVFHTHMVSYY